MEHFSIGARIRLTFNEYSHQTHKKTRNLIFYFRMISWLSWPTIPHEVNYVYFSIKLAAFHASGGAHNRVPNQSCAANTVNRLFDDFQPFKG